MPNLNPNSTGYTHSYEPNTNDLTMAMDYNDSGEPVIRTISSGITISGNVNVDRVRVEVDSLHNTIDPTHPVPISGNGSANSSSNPIYVNVTDGNITVSDGNITVTQGTDPWVVSGNVNADVSGTVTIQDGGGSITVDGNVTATLAADTNIGVTLNPERLDAFGRLRVSNPHTLFDSSLSGERRYDFDTALGGSGNINYNYNANARELILTSANGDSVERQSTRIFPYQPGKSLYSLHSFCPAQPHANVVQRIGNFSTQNGVFFEINGLTARFGVRSNSSGSVVNEYTDQSSWNVDTMDGSGNANNPSGLKLRYGGDGKIPSTMIFWNDIEWLGVGTVRFGFIIDGRFILCHKWHHANVVDVNGDAVYPTTYMGTANLPVRVEITNTGATDGSRTFKQICHTVISEGGYNPFVETNFAGTGVNTFRCSVAGTYYPIASVRVNPSYLLSTVAKICQVDILSPTVNYYRWAIILNANLTGASWTNSPVSNKVQYDTSASSFTGGYEIQSGYASSRESAFVFADDIFAWLGGFLDGTPTTFTLIIASNGNNADVMAQIGWQQIA